jgi:hypothetical protein
MFQRVHAGQVGKVSVLETLSLNVDFIQIDGPAGGEPEFGSPLILDTHGSLNEWMVGLHTGNGIGYVSSYLISLLNSNVVQKCLEAKKGKEVNPRTGRKLCDRDAHLPRTTWLLVRAMSR